MSAASCLLSEDQFLCSICLDVFTDPVSTPCGHNYCKNCISQHWDISDRCQCPMCNKVFETRPELYINTFISEMVSQFRREAQQKVSSSGQLTEAQIQQMIQKRRLKIQEIKESVKMSKDAADREKAEGVQVFTALKESVDRRLNELIKEMEDKQETTEKQAEGFIKDLEEEISELMKRSSEVEQLSHSKDHLHLLQSRIHPPSCEGTVVRAVVRAVDQLKETLSKDMKKLFEAELKRVQHYAVDVTLDPDTAHPALILSDDGKQAHCGDNRKKHSENPERFSKSVCVLAKQSFSSGRFYFEVQIKDKTRWFLGVARESVNRKQKVTLSPEKGCWTIAEDRNIYVAAEKHLPRLSLQSDPEKVGVFVDYEEGLVSFHDVDHAALIYSFTGCSFTEKLYPFFCPGVNDDGKNSAPLIICPVSQSVSDV